MPVVLRMARFGRKKRPFYRIVATDKEMRRDGRYLEIIGTLNPMIDPPLVTLREDRVKHWISEGALPSDTVSRLIEKEYPGYLSSIEEGRKERIRSHRAKRKARAGSPRPRKENKKKRGTKPKPAEGAPASEATSEQAVAS